MKDFHHLFVAGLQDIYSAEKQIIKALPDLAQAAKEPKLKEALRHHLEETKKQAVRLEKIAEELEIDLKGAQDPIMHALIQKAHKCATTDCPHEVRDAAIIAAAQCIEHHEMAVYGTLKAFACMLNFEFAEKKFDESLEEESKADEKLSEIAEGTLFSKGVNKKACDKEGR
jgi:ferritin-like metal-binding protein YciE